jgi:hypothetical protein
VGEVHVITLMVGEGMGHALRRIHPRFDPLSSHRRRRLIDGVLALDLARVLHDENVGRANCSPISTELGGKALRARQDLCFASVVLHDGTFVSTDLEGTRNRSVSAETMTSSASIRGDRTESREPPRAAGQW